MEAYRLSRKLYASVLSGTGSAIKGARWNSVGVEVIYLAANRSLAMAEVAVHFTIAMVPNDYVMTTVFVPDDVGIQKLTPANLPPNWNKFPHPLSTQAVGDKFVNENKYLLLQIPSAVTQGDYNYVVNPKHADFSRLIIIQTEKFPFDSRIFKS